MAYTKNIAIHHRLDMRIEYIYRDDKTFYHDPGTGEVTYLRGSINCIQQQAYSDMITTKQRWNKDWGVAGYHIIQSFKADEVSPYIAFEIITRFVEKHLGDKYEVAYSTHTDAENVHCHVVFNSVSFVDGSKYRGSFHDYYKGIRETSDMLCREYGLSVIPFMDDAPGGKQYTERQAEKMGLPTWRDLIRSDIDHAISAAGSYEHFVQLMQDKGYTVKINRKYHTIIPPGKEKPIRLYRLGQDYSEEAIAERILTAEPFTFDAFAGGRIEHDDDIGSIIDMPPQAWIEMLRVEHAPESKRIKVRHAPSPLKSISGLRARYWRYVFLMRRVNGKERTHINSKAAFAAREDMLQLKKLDEEYRLLSRLGICSKAELANYSRCIDARMETLISWRKQLHCNKRHSSISPEEKAELCEQTDNISKQLRALRTELKVCGRIMERAERMEDVLCLAKGARDNGRPEHALLPTERDR